MAQATTQDMYCKQCEKPFPNWGAFFIHKIESKDHICCLFCGQDFRTLEGCRRHQQMSHAAEQDLSCAGCGMTFVRVGSYISHIERRQCPIIHYSQFEAQRAQKDETYGQQESSIKLEIAGKLVVQAIPATKANSKANDNIREESGVGGGVEGLGKPLVQAILSTDNNQQANFLGDITHVSDAPVWLDSKPQEVTWEKWSDSELDEEEFPPLVKCADFPDFPEPSSQLYRDGGSKVPDLLTGAQDRLVENSTSWISKKQLFPHLLKPGTKSTKGMTTMESLGPSNPAEGEYHPFDPDDPKFNAQDHYNKFTEKYRCPWAGCMKPQKNRAGLISHLKSAAHMDLRLRCSQCLRQYTTATALVQHAESQGTNCKIRDTSEYRQAVDLLTAGFVDTAGRHRDETVRYIAPPTAVISGSGPQSMARGLAAFAAMQSHLHEDKANRLTEHEQDW